jgi:acylphosphatase
VRERAQAHGIAGSVSNRPDGTVEAVFEGPRPAVEELIRFSETGPRDAHVDSVEVRDEEVEGERGFRVR